MPVSVLDNLYMLHLIFMRKFQGGYYSPFLTDGEPRIVRVLSNLPNVNIACLSTFNIYPHLPSTLQSDTEK